MAAEHEGHASLANGVAVGEGVCVEELVVDGAVFEEGEGVGEGGKEGVCEGDADGEGEVRQEGAELHAEHVERWAAATCGVSATTTTPPEEHWPFDCAPQELMPREKRAVREKGLPLRVPSSPKKQDRASVYEDPPPAESPPEAYPPHHPPPPPLPAAQP